MSPEQKQLPGKTEPTKLALADRVEQELQELTDRNFYIVPDGRGGNRAEPDAKALQYYANKRGGIATQIVDAGVDAEKAWARVKAWLVEEPKMVKEDQVTILFEAEFGRLIWDRVDKGCPNHKAGCPILKESNGQVIIRNNHPILENSGDQLAVLRQLHRIIAFADRTCITKAEARLHKKLLSFEWREPDEIEHETQEAASVSAAKGASMALPSATTAPAPAAASAAPSKPEQPEKSKPVGVPKAKLSEKEQAEIKQQDKEKKEAAKRREEEKKTDKRKRSEVINDIGNAVACSSTNMMTFLARHLGLSDQTQIRSVEGKKIDAVLHAIEDCAKTMKPDEVRAFIIEDVPGPAQMAYAKNFAKEMEA